MVGRPKKPTQLKIVQGTVRKDRANNQEPSPPSGDIKPPSWLKGRSRTAWRWIAPVLAEMGVLTTADPHALALLCDAYAEYLEASDVVQEHGLTYETITQTGAVMIRPRPEVAIRADAWRRVNQMLQQFGLTPSSRAKVQGKPQEESDPFEDWAQKKA